MDKYPEKPYNEIMKTKKQKKNILSLLILCVMAVTLHTGCKSQKAVKRAIPEDAPAVVKKAVNDAPKDALIGIGKALQSDSTLSRTMAESRARTDIARQMGSVTTQDGNITTTITNATLENTVIIAEGEDPNGNYWVAIMMKKDTSKVNP